jgi:hypothetical protein
MSGADHSEPVTLAILLPSLILQIVLSQTLSSE